MGGTFDPVHFGHLRAAEEVYRAFKLDRIILIPSAHPPHKDESRTVNALVRYEMLTLATVFTPYFTLSALEIERPGKSYSVETVEHLLATYGQGAQLYFMVGIDAFLDITTWKDAAKLLTLCPFLVVARPGWDLEAPRALPAETLKQLGNPDFRYVKASQVDPRGLNYAEPAVYLVEVDSLDISSTDIRQRVGEGRSIKFLVPDTVEAYIRKEGLYGSPAGYQ
jgi:nicotinate-nucleotide adenylyltransferase